MTAVIVLTLSALLSCSGGGPPPPGVDGSMLPDAATADSSVGLSTATIERAPVDPIELSDGRVAELYRNPAYPCGRADASEDGSPGVHELAVVRPVGYDPASPVPSVVHVVLTGGAVGWIDDDGSYRGAAERATASWNRDRMGDFLLSGASRLMDRLRAAHPDWTFLVPSFCSHDAYSGTGGGADFPRYGWLALVSAIRWLDETAGIVHLFAEGTSSGGSGVFFIARDLAEEAPEIEVRGVVMDSQPHEPLAFAELLDAGDVRTIVADDGDEASVGCRVSWEPVATAFDRVGIGGSASADIAAGRVEAPIFHLWNRRDEQFCHDQAYDEARLHGPIANAIVDDNPGGRSVNRRACASRADDPVRCGVHGLLGGAIDEEANGREADLAAAAAAWIETLHADWAGATTTPTAF